MSNIDKVDEEESRTEASPRRVRKDSDSEEEIDEWSRPEAASTAESPDTDLAP